MKNKKVNIRKNVFETNSSSSHSVHIDDSVELLDTIVPNDEGVISLYGDEFGWEVDSHNDAHTKATYLTTAVLNYKEEAKDRLADVIKEHTGAKEVIFETNGGFYGDGYIDHESTDIASDILNSEEDIKNFLFNKNSWLFTSNDNGGGTWGITEEGEPFIQGDDW